MRDAPLKCERLCSGPERHQNASEGYKQCVVQVRVVTTSVSHDKWHNGGVWLLEDGLLHCLKSCVSSGNFFKN